MQPTPLRLSQTLWTAFRAAKPANRRLLLERKRILCNETQVWRWQRSANQVSLRSFVRHYSDARQTPDIEEKAREAKQRIDQSLESRAEIVQEAEPVLKPEKEETIVHTLPESSSIVHDERAGKNSPKTTFTTKKHPSESKDSINQKYRTWASSQWQNSPLPSQIDSLRSKASTRFSSFMDNLQSNVMIASHHLNDLTGYSGIERLKKEIEAQEEAVKSARTAVKSNRDKYSEAIAMRSTTQREVNDLLQRKHAWSAADLERFTHLYRSDHANEQAEQKTQQDLGESEAQYEEASTKLAKSILARYHEEQIWSDKIRQMSTWGTWGLMGLNVLLFIVFQILIEPWRRKRLVKGFEEKVQKALDEKDRASDEKIALIQLQAQRGGDQVVYEAVQDQPQSLVATAAEQVAEAIADAVTGATDEAKQTPHSLEEIEQAAEQMIDEQLRTDGLQPVTAVDDPAESTVYNDGPDTPTSSQQADIPLDSPTWSGKLAATFRRSLQATKSAMTYSTTSVTQQFDDKHHVVLSQRELTTKVLEGVVTGIALTCGVVFVIVKGR